MERGKKKLNFYGTSIAIVSLLKKGHYAAQISKILNIPKTTLKYHLDKLERKGVILCVSRSSMKVYKVLNTSLISSTFLRGCEKPPVCTTTTRLHNASFKFPIKIEGSTRLTDFEEVKMQNWIKKIKRDLETGCTYEISNKHLIVYPPVVCSDDEVNALLQAGSMAEKAAKKLAEKEGFIITGPPTKNRKPEFAFEILDPKLQNVVEQVNYTTEYGKTDKSKGFAEIEAVDDPNNANIIKEALNSPYTMQRIEARLGKIEQVMERQTEVLGKLSESFEKLINGFSTLPPKPKNINSGPSDFSTKGYL